MSENIMYKNIADKMKQESKKIEIPLEEYKELLEIKGKYEELQKHPEIKYIYIYETKQHIDLPPKITC